MSALAMATVIEAHENGKVIVRIETLSGEIYPLVEVCSSDGGYEKLQGCEIGQCFSVLVETESCPGCASGSASATIAALNILGSTTEDKFQRVKKTNSEVIWSK